MILFPNINIMIRQTETYIKYKHLFVDKTEKEVFLLWYNLYATKTEYSILCALLDNIKAPIFADQIIAIANLDFDKSNLAFHISNINSKAKVIGNRPLIKNIVKIGYFLNEEM